MSIPNSTLTSWLAGAATVIVVWAAKAFAKIDVPVEVAMAFTTLATVAASHYTTDAPQP